MLTTFRISFLILKSMLGPFLRSSFFQNFIILITTKIFAMFVFLIEMYAEVI